MTIEKEIAKIEGIFDIIGQHGPNVIISLAIVVVGLIAINWINRALKRWLSKLPLSPTKASIGRNILCVIMLAILIIIASVEAEIDVEPVIDLLIVVTLVTVGMIAVFFPMLPFKVGNTIKAGELFGKVEGTTILNTRLRTFDGKTVFIPNRKIIKDDIINYQFNPNRRFSLEVKIKFDQDLLKAKQALEAIMLEDPRVLAEPLPAVYLMSLEKGYMELQGRGWVENVRTFTVTCELLEKTKFRFDQEGIVLAGT